MSDSREYGAGEYEARVGHVIRHELNISGAEELIHAD